MLKALFFLQLVWASSYAAQKIALAQMPLGLVLVLRYGLATLFFLLAGRLRFREKFSGGEWALILFSGVINFSGSPYFQLKALTMTYAIDTSILVAFEPLITALLAVVFLKERVVKTTWITFLMATTGIVVMSGWQGNNSFFQWTRFLGDMLFLLALFCEGINSSISKHLAQRHHPFSLIAWMIAAGFMANLAGNWQKISLQQLSQISMEGWMILLYLALFCSVLGYGGWVYLLKRIPLNQLALSLFLQPVLGTLLATFILREKLDGQTLLGGFIVVLALFFWLRHRLSRSRHLFEGMPLGPRRSL